MRVKFETSKFLKELGFTYPHVVMHKSDEPNNLPRPEFVNGVTDLSGEWCYEDNGKLIRPKQYNPNNKHYPAPLQYLVQKWLRDIGIHITIMSFHNTGHWVYDYVVETTIYKTDNFNSFTTYEEALEQGILEGLKILQKK